MITINAQEIAHASRMHLCYNIDLYQFITGIFQFLLPASIHPLRLNYGFLTLQLLTSLFFRNGSVLWQFFPILQHRFLWSRLKYGLVELLESPMLQRGVHQICHQMVYLYTTTGRERKPKTEPSSGFTTTNRKKCKYCWKQFNIHKAFQQHILRF